MKKFIVITGPTATGKTALSVSLAKRLNSEVISADSMQIYKGMDIGTAKVSPHEMQGVRHHFVDIIEPNEDYSVAIFQRDALKVIDEINEDGRVQIIAGGSGLYVNALVYQLEFSKVQRNDDIRQKYTKMADDKSVEYLYNELEKIDPKYASIIAKQDKRRIIRRLEIIESGADTDYDFRRYNEDYEIIIIGLTMPRDILYERVNKRVDAMMELGLLQEVKSVYEKFGMTTALKAIGYKEMIGYLDGEYDLDEAVRLVKRNTRRFAKRQLTWFKKDERIKWFDVINRQGTGDTLSDMLDYMKEKGFQHAKINDYTSGCFSESSPQGEGRRNNPLDERVSD